MNLENITDLLLSYVPFYACNNEQEYEGKPQKSNVIYVLVDNLGYGDTELYGQELIKTSMEKIKK